MPDAVVRPVTPADAEALAAVMVAARDAGELAGSSDPQATWMVRLALGGPGEAAVAVAGDVVVGVVLPEAKAIVVVPGHRRRGIGRALVAAGLEIERERGRPDLLAGVLPDDAVGRAFLGATGFGFHSTLWDLELRPGTPMAAPSWPPGIRVRDFERATDTEPWVTLFNAAFADHPTPISLDPARVAGDWDASLFQDIDLALAEDRDGVLLGFCATEPRRGADGAVGPVGEIWTVGVRPGHQGRGLGRQLLRWGVAHLRGLGVRTVTLSVNGRNPRALGLYEAEGFTPTTTRERWSRPVPPAP